MTAAQKAAKEKFSKAIAYRKKTGVSLKEAFAHIYGKKVGAVKKKAAPKKKAAVKKATPKKKAAVKKADVKKVAQVKAAPAKTTVKKYNSITTVSGVKKAAAKKVTGSHKDTKSHNVNIRVVSGYEKYSSSVLDELNFLSNKISKMEILRDRIKLNIKYKKYSVDDMPEAKRQLKGYNEYIKSLKVNLRNLKKHIK
jgi:hypothetical protein